MSGGFVSLVGAGPGDPELLTVRAVARLREADLVLYDALAGREALGLAPRARWFYVGTRARRRSIAQESIERLMIRAARRGERVVRLKSGDPFVLGRGGEEALTLARAGVPYEVVPGVTFPRLPPRRWREFRSRTAASRQGSRSSPGTPSRRMRRCCRAWRPDRPQSSCSWESRIGRRSWSCCSRVDGRHGPQPRSCWMHPTSRARPGRERWPRSLRAHCPMNGPSQQVCW
jgi:hypothetical protein